MLHPLVVFTRLRAYTFPSLINHNTSFDLLHLFDILFPSTFSHLCFSSFDLLAAPRSRIFLRYHPLLCVRIRHASSCAFVHRIFGSATSGRPCRAIETDTQIIYGLCVVCSRRRSTTWLRLQIAIICVGYMVKTREFESNNTERNDPIPVHDVEDRMRLLNGVADCGTT